MHGIVHRFYYRDMLREAIHTIHFDFRYESAAGVVLRGGRTNLTGRRSSGWRSLLAFDDISILLQERGRSDASIVSHILRNLLRNKLNGGALGVSGVRNSAHCRVDLGSTRDLLRNIFRLLALIIGWDRCALG